MRKSLAYILLFAFFALIVPKSWVHVHCGEGNQKISKTHVKADDCSFCDFDLSAASFGVPFAYKAPFYQVLKDYKRPEIQVVRPFILKETNRGPPQLA